MATRLLLNYELLSGSIWFRGYFCIQVPCIKTRNKRALKMWQVSSNFDHLIAHKVENDLAFQQSSRGAWLIILFSNYDAATYHSADFSVGTVSRPWDIVSSELVGTTKVHQTFQLTGSKLSTFQFRRLLTDMPFEKIECKHL